MTAQWFGDYEIVKRLRVGGMATLYLARRHGAAGFSRLVALKMIHPHMIEQPAFVEMFVDEARICSRITHPNVVHVEEFGVIDGVHYLVMEFLDGCSVSELLQVCGRRRRRLDPELAARVIMQIARGLHAAHETVDQDGEPLDIVHRDISPSNILLSTDGNAKLIDFGIARAKNRLSETQAGVTLKGKYKYVAPEQATRGPVDRRCDIFSLGVVFWEMLVGRPLFPDDSYVTLFNRLQHTEVEPPSAVNPDVPTVLDPIVLSMLQHDPSGRPNTASDVERRIAAALPGAANREAAELGALAREVRDVCTAQRGTDDGAGSSPVGFSPTPRSMRPPTIATRAEPEAQQSSGTPGSASTQPRAQSPWTRRPIWFAAAGLIAGLGVVGVIAMRNGRTAPQHTAGQPRTLDPDDTSGPAPATGAISPLPSATLPAPPVRQPVQPAQPAPSEVATAPASGDSAAAPPTGAANPAPAAAATAPAPAPTTSGTRAQAPSQPAVRQATPSASTVREVSRAPVRQRPTRVAPPPPPTTPPAPAIDPVATRPPPRPAGGVTPPFARNPFDDPDNERPTNTDPSVVKVKKVPIVPGFDN